MKIKFYLLFFYCLVINLVNANDAIIAINDSISKVNTESNSSSANNINIVKEDVSDNAGLKISVQQNRQEVPIYWYSKLGFLFSLLLLIIGFVIYRIFYKNRPNPEELIFAELRTEVEEDSINDQMAINEPKLASSSNNCEEVYPNRENKFDLVINDYETKSIKAALDPTVNCASVSTGASDNNLDNRPCIVSNFATCMHDGNLFFLTLSKAKNQYTPYIITEKNNNYYFTIDDTNEAAKTNAITFYETYLASFCEFVNDLSAHHASFELVDGSKGVLAKIGDRFTVVTKLKIKFIE